MEASKLKNMVVLKNLPSNIIDEAIIVLKGHQKVKKLQKIEQRKKAQGSDPPVGGHFLAFSTHQSSLKITPRIRFTQVSISSLVRTPASIAASRRSG